MSGTRAGALKGWETRRLMHRPTKRNDALDKAEARTRRAKEAWQQKNAATWEYINEHPVYNGTPGYARVKRAETQAEKKWHQLRREEDRLRSP